MQKIYGMTAACALVLVSCQIASASEGHSLPWGDFLLRVINGAIFVGIIWYAAGKLIKKFFTDRREGIVREMDDLAKRKAEAEANLAEVERRIADVEAECAKLLEEGRAQAERIKASILAEAEKQAAHIVEQAALGAEQEGKAELEAIRARMAETIVAEVKKSLLDRLDAKTHQKLIDKSLTKVVLQ
ncbi:F0F1 ATP synthase subunit B [Mailhella massiliensis]|uniref:F0F1 ATP synthase subunit B family protein n=1 Tax=Mailhella massiliensis TaxID=1903261 RepID=UPI001EF4CF48|nr:F0F1 ATP synthase subunit B [Mailhella massiliensis]